MTADSIIQVFEEITKANSSMSFPDRWHKTKEIARTKLSNEKKDFEQSWKSASGKAFEKIAISQVLKVLTKEIFIDSNVIAKRWFELTPDEKEDLEVQLRRKCGGDRVNISNEPDIVIFKSNKAKAILSCKSSLRDRVNIDLFWAEINSREGRKFLVVSASSTQELGTHKKPKKPRKIAECLYERLYIVNGDTDYCEIVRPFKDLESDLTKWFL